MEKSMDMMATTPTTSSTSLTTIKFIKYNLLHTPAYMLLMYAEYCPNAHDCNL